MKKYLYLTSAAGVLGVSAGAFGAHALKDILTEAGTLSIWNTAVLYHLIHVLALLVTTLFSSNQTPPSRWLRKACQCWLLGILLFSGSLYSLALGGPRLLGPVTPLGGIFLILGWVCVIGFSSKPASKA
ncbi:MAG: DUF423 domain-containing protein [Rariglobus sp.]|nr:DUF423 domain-containing protein [Rariglobus sp.]